MQQVSLVPISAALRLEDAMDEVLGRVLGELNELEASPSRSALWKKRLKVPLWF